MQKVYEWKMSSFAKGIDANEAQQELERIENVYGAITPEYVLEGSKSNNALFHNLFTWDDAEAANKYRLSQARNILNNIEVRIISDGQPRVIPVYEVITTQEGRVYKHIDTLTNNDIQQVKSNTIRDLNSLRSKLSLYKEFEGAILKMDEVSKIISEV